MSELPVTEGSGGRSLAAGGRLTRPWFHADWEGAVFIHFEVEPEALQNVVPFQLELHQGRAFVSFVAFTMMRFRPASDTRIGAWLLRPLSNHGFLNLRTYVRAGGETGIYFLAEWLSNRLAVPLGPALFGLPYRFGRLSYCHRLGGPEIGGAVSTSHGRLVYRASIEPGAQFGPCIDGSLDEFLLERYVAFTKWRDYRRFFRVWHEPWNQAPIRIEIQEESLLAATGRWSHGARLIGAHFSPGAFDVRMGPPQVLR